jgi:hypothetical protein
MDNVSRAPSYGTVNKIIGDQDHLLQDVGSVNFNIHRFVREIGRKSALSVLTVHIMRRLHIYPNPQLNESTFVAFLGEIYKGYRREVEYHNDIHAADVL